MQKADRQTVIDINDEGLRRYTHDHLKGFAKFPSSNCAVCEQLAPPFAQFADDEPYRTIVFLRLAPRKAP